MNIVIYGATSAMAKEVARKYSDRKASFHLVGRTLNKVDEIKRDLISRGAQSVTSHAVDFLNFDELNKNISTLTSASEKIDLVVVAHGALPVQEEVQDDFDKIKFYMDVNLTSYITILSGFSSFMEKQGFGTFAIFTSVAGDRGRKSNYVYGSFKAAMQSFLSGLRARMSRANVNVLDIRPGFVDTPMTSDYEKNFLFVSPRHVAKDVVKAIDKKKAVLYTPFFWAYIMLIIKSIPTKIFNKLNF